MQWKLRRAALFAALAALVAAPTAAQDRYIIHDNPWGEGATINDAANDVFGAGGWNHSTYAGANAASIFSGTTRFVYLEGGDGTEAAFTSFLNSHRPLIESWVQGGGRLLVNAATWGLSPNTVFGVSLNYGGPLGADFQSGSAIDGGHPLFSNMGYGSPGTSWTGNFFAHNTVSGAGLTGLIQNGGGATIFAEAMFGGGFAMFGGLTTNNWHQPHPQAASLTRNILAYGDGRDVAVPEPMSLLLLGTGLAGVVVARRRRLVEEA